MGTDPADLPPPSRNDDGAPQQNTAAPKRPFSPDDQQAVRFEDVFCLEEIQRIQDAFAEAAGVGSRITDPSGRPLTQPSNFTTLCQDIIRQTPKGLANCIRSDIHEGVSTADGPCYGTCLSGGLLDGSTSIFFGDRHIANWIIGQVLDEDADPEVLLAYAREIGANEKAYREALALVPRMSKARFAKICRALYHFANHLSALALKNYEQSQSINELRQAQNRIRARDRNLADIIDFFPDPTLVLDKDGTVIFWNKALERLTGVAAVDMLGKTNQDYGAPFYGVPTPLLIDYARGAATLTEGRYAVASLEQDEIIAEVTLPALPGGPRHVWAKAVALYDDQGHISGAIEAIRDVTDRHSAETALRESEEKFRRIIETAYEGIWVFDADFHTSFVNQRMADMLGYPPDAMLGKKFDAFVPDGSLEEKIIQQKRRHPPGQGDVFEHSITRKDGNTLWVLISASPLYDGDGRYLGALGMFTDITARKEIEKELHIQRRDLEAQMEARTRDLRLQALELAEANIRMSELDRLKSAFLSTVSHELRTPLTSILGFAKLIGREFGEHFLPLVGDNPLLAGKGKRIAENLAVVFHEAERLTRLINDVLDLNRIESGNMLWRDSLFDPVAVLRKAAQNIEGILAQHPGIVFDFVADENIPYLFMDPDQLIQVVANLLQNAIKFTKEGAVHMELHRDGDAVCILVRDQGVGIPADQLESIFDKFHQVGRGDTMTETAKGTGLGLAICRQIVRHYGGQIWAISTLGKGSTFYVRLPLPDVRRDQNEV